MFVLRYAYHYVALAGYFPLYSSVLFFLVLAPSAVQAQSNKITVSSLLQCGSFSVNFAGGRAPRALILQLAVVPINATPSVFILRSSAWNETSLEGAYFTFLPLSAGTEFVASLDDAEGDPTGVTSVSDVTVVSPSSTNDISCLGPSGFSPHYVVQGILTQCEPFNLANNYSTTSSSPSIGGFQPRGQPFHVPSAGPDSVPGVSAHTIDAAHDTQVLQAGRLYANDDNDPR